MSIEHISGQIDWLGIDTTNNRTAFERPSHHCGNDLVLIISIVLPYSFLCLLQLTCFNNKLFFFLAARKRSTSKPYH